MLEYDKCLSHRRNAGTINLQNPMQRATSQISFTTYLLNQKSKVRLTLGSHPIG